MTRVVALNHSMKRNFGSPINFAKIYIPKKWNWPNFFYHFLWNSLRVLTIWVMRSTRAQGWAIPPGNLAPKKSEILANVSIEKKCQKCYYIFSNDHWTTDAVHHQIGENCWRPVRRCFLGGRGLLWRLAEHFSKNYSVLFWTLGM